MDGLAVAVSSAGLGMLDSEQVEEDDRGVGGLGQAGGLGGNSWAESLGSFPFSISLPFIFLPFVLPW